MVVFGAKQHQHARPPPMAADVVEAVEIHDVDRVARRAEALGHVEDSVAFRRAVPEPDRIDDIEFRPWGGRPISAEVLDDCFGIVCAWPGEPPGGTDRETAPAELMPPFPGFSPEPDRGPRAPQGHAYDRLRGSHHSNRPENCIGLAASLS